MKKTMHTKPILAVFATTMMFAACGPNPTSPTKPTASPTAVPTAAPTTTPTTTPTTAPTTGPTAAPTTAPTSGPTVAPTTAPTSGPTLAPPVPTAPPVEYMQVERLGRPAINEGLIMTNDLLNTWNSVPPTVEADFLAGKSQAAKPIVDEATAVLKALGNTDAEVAGLFKALLPDVMRIDTNRPSGYAGSAPGKLDNVTKDLRPMGGRMIKDDVIDVTLSLVVPKGAPSGTAIDNLESDNVTYEGPNANGTAHKAVLSDFPYLAAPN